MPAMWKWHESIPSVRIVRAVDRSAAATVERWRPLVRRSALVLLSKSRRIARKSLLRSHDQPFDDEMQSLYPSIYPTFNIPESKWRTQLDPAESLRERKRSIHVFTVPVLPGRANRPQTGRSQAGGSYPRIMQAAPISMMMDTKKRCQPADS